MVTSVDAPSEPIVSGYGAPDTEFTIWQSEPVVASGWPTAVTVLCSTLVMRPLSGGPAAPGETTTAQPMVTGGPGMVQVALKLVVPAMVVVEPLSVAAPWASA